MRLCPPTFQADLYIIEILFILTIMQKSATRKKMRPSSMYFSCYCFSCLPNWGPKLLRNSQCEEWCFRKRNKNPTSKKSQVVTSRTDSEQKFRELMGGIWIWLQNNKTTRVIVKSILMKAPTNLTSILIIFQALTKGQLISERIYEVSPKIRTKNCQDFCPV